MRRHVATGLIIPGLLIAGQVLADPVIAGSEADGDITFLTVYEVPSDLRSDFEKIAKSEAAQTIETSGRFWLMYEQLTPVDSDGSASYFTIHIPHTLTEITDPDYATGGLVAKAGQYRDHAELTRQVPDWCTTTALDASKLIYAHAEYYWLRADTLESVGRIFSARGEILRTLYGTGSDGNLAYEGFVTMVAPFQVMTVLFSSEASQADAEEQLKKDLEDRGLAGEWNRLSEELTSYVAKSNVRSGMYRPELSAAP